MVKKKFPKQGDVVWITFDPTLGHEQSGRRPAVVISGDAYNKISGLMLVCPVTSQAKGFPFEVSFATKKIQGIILADQIRCVDWNHSERKCEISSSLTSDVLKEVHSKISALIELGG